MTSSKKPASSFSAISELKEQFPPIPETLPDMLRQLIEAMCRPNRFGSSMTADRALSMAAYEAGMVEAAHQLEMIHRLQSRPKDPDGKSEHRSTHRWPPAGAKS